MLSFKSSLASWGCNLRKPYRAWNDPTLAVEFVTAIADLHYRNGKCVGVPRWKVLDLIRPLGEYGNMMVFPKNATKKSWKYHPTCKGAWSSVWNALTQNDIIKYDHQLKGWIPSSNIQNYLKYCSEYRKKLL
jgi:hypothetical protein